MITIGSIRGRALQIVVVLGVALFPIRSASATDRFFSDITVSSPDDHYRLDLKSPDNAKGGRVPFQRDFVYTLTDTRTNKPVWSRTQPKDGEASPVQAWVHDSGRAVVRTGWEDLLVFSAGSATPVGVVEILKQFPKTEYDANVHQTTAGPMWSQSARWYFADIGGNTHFVVRAWWGRRVIVDLTTAAVVPDEGKVHEAAVAAERADILAILARASKLEAPELASMRGESSWRMFADVDAAAHLAGREQIKEAVPFLLALENWDYSGSSSTIPLWFDNPLPQGSVDPFSWSEFTLRARVQTALRRLGTAPAGLPATQFKYYHHEYSRQRPVVITLDSSRDERVVRVKAGMSPFQVLRTIAEPDAVVRSGHEIAWEYDIDGDDPFTLHVVWNQTNPPTVEKVSQIRPPVWKNTTIRDDD